MPRISDKKADRMAKDGKVTQATATDGKLSEASTPPARMSDRDRLFLAEWFANGMNATEAELSVAPRGLTRESANADGSRRLARIRATADFAELMAAAGLDDLGIVGKAKELFNANDVKFDAIGGKHIVPDNRARLGALQTVGKWVGKEKNVLTVDTGPIEIKLSHDVDGI